MLSGVMDVYQNMWPDNNITFSLAFIANVNSHAWMAQGYTRIPYEYFHLQI